MRSARTVCQEITPIHPEAGRTAQGSARRDLRSDRLPGAGAVRGANPRRLFAGQGRRAASSDGQEEAGSAGQGEDSVLRRHEGAWIFRRGRAGRVGHPRAVLRLRVQQGAFGRIRFDLLLDRVSENALSGGVHGRPAARRQHEQRQDRAVPGRGATHGHPGAFSGRERVGVRVFGSRRRRAIRPRRHPQRRQERGRCDHRGT